MFVIPVGNRVDWNRPPVATLLLIAVNCVVFFVFQSGDERAEEGAARYYLASELPGIEWPRYTDYLKIHGKARDAAWFSEMAGQEETADAALAVMESDGLFMRELHAGHIVAEDDPVHADWSRQRGEFEKLQRAAFTERHILHVDDPNPADSFTSAFMHGSVGHLLGNMVVLFLVGFLVEAVIGKGLFLLAYVVSIFTSDAIYLLVQAEPGSRVLGASGAIAGVMGLYAVVFGRRKIDFFYSLLFYFDYVRGPAIALLPVWLLNELYQFLTNDGSNVAFMAHFGGLLGGAAMGGLYLWWRPAVIESGHEVAERPEMDRRLYQKGLDYLGAMEFRRALDVFQALQQAHADDLNLARQVYQAAKFDPAGEDFHRAACHLLELIGTKSAGVEQLHGLYREYLTLAKPSPRLDRDLSVRLARWLAGGGYCEEAEQLVGHVMKWEPAHAALPEVLLTLARSYYRAGRADKYRAALTLIVRRFPEAPESPIAGQLLRAD